MTMTNPTSETTNSSPASPLVQMEMSDSIAKLTEALAKAKEDMGTEIIGYDAQNPHFKNRFASLEACVKSINPSLSKQGLTLIQLPTGSHLINLLSHKSGEWIRSSYKLNPVKNDPQGIGSALTYARRYSICAILNVSGGEDDDAELAQGNVNSGGGSSSGKTPKQIFDELVGRKFKDAETFSKYCSDNWSSIMGNLSNGKDRSALAKLIESKKKNWANEF